MPRCVTIRRKKRKVCIGDLDTVIDIQKRSLSDGFDSAEKEDFTSVITPWALVETLTNKFIVDEVSGGDVEVTHKFIIRIPEVEISSENWIILNSKRYRILGQEDYDERGEFLAISATSRGSDTREAASA